MNSYSYVSLAVLLLLFACTACVKDEPKVFTSVSFIIPATVTPERDTFALGDTLWLRVNCSDSLLDLHSNRRFRVQPQDLPLLTSVAFQELLGQTSEKVSATAAFQLVNQVGTLSIVGPTFGRLTQVYNGQSYQARIGIIPQRRGIFALTVLVNMGNYFEKRNSLELPFVDLGPTSDGKEQIPTYAGMLYTLNEGRTNFALLQQHSRTISATPGAPESEVLFEQQSTFAFMVQ